MILREIAEAARDGYEWPLRESDRFLFGTPSEGERVRRGLLWASYTAREKLAQWIDPGPTPFPALPPARAFLGEPPCGRPGCGCTR